MHPLQPQPQPQLPPPPLPADVLLVLMPANARSAAARALDAKQADGSPLPPLLAAPFVIADNIETSVGVTSAGLSFLDEWEAGVDGPLVEAAQAAGGLLIGKAVLSELSFATTGVNPTFGTPRNVSPRCSQDAKQL